MMSCVTKYLSPQHKVQQFLQRSRDLWKKKHHDLKMKIKLASNQVRAVEQSRETWRARAEAAEAEIKNLQAQKNIDQSKAS